LLVWFDLNAWPQYAQVAGLAQVQDCRIAGDAGGVMAGVMAGVDAGVDARVDGSCNEAGDCHLPSVRIVGLDAFILFATVGRSGAALPYES
jgi:hypothetical protein